jgi:hypothetical protein
MESLGYVCHDGNRASPHLVFQFEVLAEPLSIREIVDQAHQPPCFLPTLKILKPLYRWHFFPSANKTNPTNQPIQQIEPIQLFYSHFGKNSSSTGAIACMNADRRWSASSTLLFLAGTHTIRRRAILS